MFLDELWPRASEDTRRPEMTRKSSQQLLVLGVLTLQVSRDLKLCQRKPEQSFSHFGSAASFAVSMQLLALLLHRPGLTIGSTPHRVPSYRTF